MKSYKSKKTFPVILVLVSLFHLAVINLGSFHTEQRYGARGGFVHNIYIGYDSGGKGGSAASEKEKKLTENKDRKKHVRPKSRLIPKEEATKLKSVENIDLDRSYSKDSATHDLEEPAGFDASGRGGTDGYGSYGGGGISLEQIKLAYLNALKIEIEKNKEYLMIVKSSDQTGIVGISFIILKDGAIIDVTLRKRSKYPTLNILALRLISKLKRFRPIPYELKMDRWKIDIDIEYKLGG
jgi:TonB family protein